MLKKIIRSLVLVAVLVIGYFAARESFEATRPSPPPPTYQFLILGDSHTVPIHVVPPDRWPQQMIIIFREENVLANNPHIIAEIGMQTERLAAKIDNSEYMGKYDLVLLQAGGDDIVAGVDTETYRVKFASLLAKAKAIVEGDSSRVIVLSIPDWTVIRAKDVPNRKKIRKKIDRFNAINEEESSNSGVRYINITSLSRMAADDLSFLSDDRKNPSDYMYEIWARKVYPVALTALGL